MNKENRVLGCGFERRKEACKVEADSLGVVVWIVYWLNTNVLQDGLVIGYFDNILFIRKLFSLSFSLARLSIIASARFARPSISLVRLPTLVSGKFIFLTFINFLDKEYLNFSEMTL